jgi:hypothetical protein
MEPRCHAVTTSRSRILVHDTRTLALRAVDRAVWILGIVVVKPSPYAKATLLGGGFLLIRELDVFKAGLLFAVGIFKGTLEMGCSLEFADVCGSRREGCGHGR